MSADANSLPSPPVEPLFDAPALAARVAELGREIERELAQEDPLLLALLGGSVIFLADLVRAIERPVRFEFVHGRRLRRPARAPRVEPTHPLPHPRRASPGRACWWSRTWWPRASSRPTCEQQLREPRRRARCASPPSIDLPDERKTDCQVDYRAFTTRRSGLLVGYGLKHQGRYGQPPYRRPAGARGPERAGKWNPLAAWLSLEGIRPR